MTQRDVQPPFVSEIAQHLAKAIALAMQIRQHELPSQVVTHAILVGQTRNNLLTIEEVAEMLQVPVNTIYQWRSHRPPYGPAAIKVGKYLRWKPELVQAWIDAQSEL